MTKYNNKRLQHIILLHLTDWEFKVKVQKNIFLCVLPALKNVYKRSFQSIHRQFIFGHYTVLRSTIHESRRDIESEIN